MSSPEPTDDPAGGVDRAAVEARLDRVDDPELDRSIVELEYVDQVRIEDGEVSVAFVLPTAWCSPAFAWMMATGIRDEVGRLPGVESVHVELRDHMHEEGINRGVNDSLSFETVFEDAEGGVEDVRRALDRKARLARQYAAFEALQEAGLDPGQMANLTTADVEFVDDRVAVRVRDGALTVMTAADPVRSYLEKAREVGLVTAPDDPVFADREGRPFDPADFEAVRRQARLARSNLDGQAGICSQLHEARNGVQPSLDD